MQTQKHYVVRQKNRFTAWAWSPIIVLRVSLVATYLVWVFASAIAFIDGVPIFNLTTPQGWTPVWATVLGTSAIVSAIGSLADRWQKLEKWSSMVLSAMILTYVISLNSAAWLEGDLTREFAGAIAIIAAILPVTRFVYLAAQTGKKHAEPITS